MQSSVIKSENLKRKKEKLTIDEYIPYPGPNAFLILKKMRAHVRYLCNVSNCLVSRVFGARPVHFKPFINTPVGEERQKGKYGLVTRAVYELGSGLSCSVCLSCLYPLW